MRELEIAPATADDIDDVHRIEEQSFPAAWRRSFFESELTAGGRFNIVAKRDGRVVGYVFAMWFFDEMHVNKIAVAESERRQGIALALMQRCLRFAQENGVATISLEVRKSNDAAQEFYRFFDFEPTYVRPRYYPDGEAAVVMTRKV